MNQKAHVACDFNYLFENVTSQGHSQSRTLHVVISRKWCHCASYYWKPL